MSDKNNINYIISARDLSVVRDGKTLLDRVNLGVREGSLTMLLGHNGAGKSVLLQTLHGVFGSVDGTITAPPAGRQKMVFQKPVLLRRTARRHFDFVCPGLAEADVDAWFSHANLSGQKDIMARRLSGGEQQKLALIGALASNPTLLFLDEPTSRLDYESTTAIEHMIIEAHKMGTTIIVTSHNRAQAERLAEDVLFIHKGKILETADSETFFAAPEHPAAKQFLNHL